MATPSATEACEALRALGRRIAAAAALLVALVSLLQHAPLWLACLRGGAVLLALALAARLGTAALARALELDRARAAPEEEARS